MHMELLGMLKRMKETSLRRGSATDEDPLKYHSDGRVGDDPDKGHGAAAHDADSRDMVDEAVVRRIDST